MDDLISRQAALSVFGDMGIHPLDYNTHAYIAKIKSLPSVTPQQKVGRWIPYKVENEKNVILNDDLSKEETLHQQDWVEEYEPCYICSCCGKTNFYRNYCPNCGAKMVETQEGDG